MVQEVKSLRSSVQQREKEKAERATLVQQEKLIRGKVGAQGGSEDQHADRAPRPPPLSAPHTRPPSAASLRAECTRCPTCGSGQRLVARGAR